MRVTLRRACFVAVASALIGASMAAVPASAAPLCFGKPATIVGSANPNVFEELVGTPGPDVIVARDGDDSIDGRGGNDRICGGDGFDFIRGGPGNDRIVGGRGSDTLHGGPGRDRLDGAAGSQDALFGGRGRDVLEGGPGNFDGLIGGRGDDHMDGGTGLDSAQFFNARGPIVADLSTDTVTGNGDDVVVDIEGIVGSNFDDVIIGDDGSNLLIGQGGDDTIEARGSGSVASGAADLIGGGPGIDLLDGGAGGDVIDYDDSPSPVTVDLESGTASGWGNDTLMGIEAVIGSDFDDILSGDEGDNAFVGGAGSDVIDGAGGNDEAAYFDSFEPVSVDLSAGTAAGWGDDALTAIENVTGSAHADEIVGDPGPNTIVGGSGGDSLSGLDGDDVLIGSNGTDSADGGAGTDSCDAEVEIDCETDPFTYAGARRWGGWVVGITAT